MLFRDREHPDLLRSEPYRKLPLEMLDKKPYETLKGTKRRPMNHDRAVWLVIGPPIVEIETLRQTVIDLNGAKLPFTPDNVFDHKVDLGAVKCRLSGLLVQAPGSRCEGVAAARQGGQGGGGGEGRRRGESGEG